MQRLGHLAKISALLLFILGGAGTVVSACNTIEGAGEDVNAAGKGITKGAKQVKKDL